jgi:hypothetical protein
MKKLVLIFTLLTYGAAYGQLMPIHSISWISLEMQMMDFRGAEVLFEPYKEGDPLEYYLSEDTLVLVNKNLNDEGSDNLMHRRLYKFLMYRKGNEQLILTPINDNAKKLDKLPFYTFTNKKNIIDRSLKFKIVHLNSGGCPGCKLRTINIDDKGNFYLKKGGGLDTGYFKGKLNSRQLDTLNDLLHQSGIRKLQSWIPDRWHTGGGAQNLIIEYNGNILSVKNNILPLVIRDLLNFVHLFATKLLLVPDREQYNYKREGDETYEYKSEFH